MKTPATFNVAALIVKFGDETKDAAVSVPSVHAGRKQKTHVGRSLLVNSKPYTEPFVEPTKTLVCELLLLVYTAGEEASMPNPRSAFWHAGVAAGGADEGRPGLRDYHACYYGAFLRDPDGNRVEAVCHLPT